MSKRDQIIKILLESHSHNEHYCGLVADKILALDDWISHQTVIDMKEAMQEFVDRCEKGEVRSRYTYAKFKEILSRPPESKNESIPVNLPWEPGTDEHKNPETNIVNIVDEPNETNT